MEGIHQWVIEMLKNKVRKLATEAKGVRWWEKCGNPEAQTPATSGLHCRSQGFPCSSLLTAGDRIYQ
jgi:hypothetical protein